MTGIERVSHPPLGPGTLRQEIARLLALGVPSALTQLGSMTLSFVDVAMLGRVGRAELDASALGAIWIWGTSILAIGLVLGIDPIVSQATGAGDGRRVGLALQRGIVVAVLASVPIAVLFALTEPALVFAGQSPTLSKMAHDYVVVQIPSLPLFFAYFALRQYLQGRGLVAPALWVMLIGNVFNFAADWVLIFGVDAWGVPGMGLLGAGIATALTRAFLCLALLGWIVARGLHRGAWLPWSRESVRAEGLIEVLRYGAPTSLQFGLEVWAFQAAGLIAGRLGEVPLAAHSVVLNLASMSFTLAFGLAIGTTTRVGNLLGMGEREAAQRAAWLGMGFGGATMGACAIAFVTAREALPAVLTPDPEVIAVAATLLPIAAAFQVFDGIQAVGGGVLRACGDTRPAAIANAVGYYVVALPAATVLVWWAGLGVVGVWWGLAIGLAVVAIVLVVRVHRAGPRTARRIQFSSGAQSEPANP